MSAENPTESDAASERPASVEEDGAPFPMRRFLVAAVVLVAVGGALLFLLRPARTTDEGLERAARELAQAAPELFEEFRPLSAAERGERLPVVERGGLRVLEPRGTILNPAPTFAWDAVAGAVSYRVGVRDQEGRVVFETETSATRLAYPTALVDPLPQGRRFVLTLEATTPDGSSRGSQAFRTLAEPAVERYERGLAVIHERIGEPERAVLSAHWAARHGLLQRAAALLPPQPGDSGPAYETSRWIGNRLGENSTP